LLVPPPPPPRRVCVRLMARRWMRYVFHRIPSRPSRPVTSATPPCERAPSWHSTDAGLGNPHSTCAAASPRDAAGRHGGGGGGCAGTPAACSMRARRRGHPGLSARPSRAYVPTQRARACAVGLTSTCARRGVAHVRDSRGIGVGTVRRPRPGRDRHGTRRPDVYDYGAGCSGAAAHPGRRGIPRGGGVGA
jgi:hypothetical protein